MQLWKPDIHPQSNICNSIYDKTRYTECSNIENINIDDRVPFTDSAYGMQSHISLTSDSSHTDTILQFLDKTFIDMIVNESNAFYRRVKEDLERYVKLTHQSRLHTVDISGKDIYNIFFSIWL